jgi:hypothetical protein
MVPNASPDQNINLFILPNSFTAGLLRAKLIKRWSIAISVI